MSRFSDFGNDLYTGRRSIDFVGRLKTWYIISAVLFLLALGGIAARGINLGIEFTGGSDFRVTSVNNIEGYEQRASRVVTDTGGVDKASVSRVGTNDVRVQTERFDDRRAQDVRAGLAKEFGVGVDNVRSSVVGPSWGESVTNQAIRALVVFLVLVAIVLALYFRTWKMAFAALVALAHDIFITVGIYALAGFEVTPASMIGFLTILGYSLYDTVVVFDKVRENTSEAVRRGNATYSQAANLAVNQTLVRSINTSVVALLPVAAILVIGFAIIGPGTLLDLSLALFIGIAVGTYSSIFIATPLLAQLREREPVMEKLRHRVERRAQRGEDRPHARGSEMSPVRETAPARGVGARPVGGATALGGVDAVQVRTSTPRPADEVEAEHGDEVERTATGRPIHPYAQRGPRNQPKRTPRSKR